MTASGDPDDPKRATRVDLAWARQQVELFGRESAWVQVNVLGVFPPASLNALLGVEEVTAAMRRPLRAEQFEWAQKRLGIDCSRFGDDLTVLFPRQGLAAGTPVVMRHARNSSVSVDIATQVLALKARGQSEMEFLDATGGFAAGTIDVLRAQGCEPIDIQFHAPARDPRYANQRAELYFALTSWIHRGGALPNIPELVAELTTLTYTFTAQGKLLLESKDQVKARLGRSPDRADALACTFGLPEMPRDLVLGRGSIGKVLIDYEPYADLRGND